MCIYDCATAVAFLASPLYRATSLFSRNPFHALIAVQLYTPLMRTFSIENWSGAKYAAAMPFNWPLLRFNWRFCKAWAQITCVQKWRSIILMCRTRVAPRARADRNQSNQSLTQRIRQLVTPNPVSEGKDYFRMYAPLLSIDWCSGAARSISLINFTRAFPALKITKVQQFNLMHPGDE
jgi:hypothetical protein